MTLFWLLLLVEGLFWRLLVDSIVSAQKLFGKPLSINNKFFIVTRIFYLYLTNLFSLYMYSATYFITISFFL